MRRPDTGAVEGRGLGHVCSFLGCRSGSGPCRSALRCGRPEPAKDGRLHRSDPTEPAGQVCGPAGLGLSRSRACPRAERVGSAAPRRDSGLEPTGRRFRPQRTRRAVRHGSDITPNAREKAHGQARHADVVSNPGDRACDFRPVPELVEVTIGPATERPALVEARWIRSCEKPGI
ncbi:unnamed protein product [Ciceribacter sp. T2.26MG-112.2]|nr:unnamed protein product [Ciceribacter naphthalenivorans]